VEGGRGRTPDPIPENRRVRCWSPTCHHGLFRLLKSHPNGAKTAASKHCPAHPAASAPPGRAQAGMAAPD